jgi:hypothetical protein
MDEMVENQDEGNPVSGHIFVFSLCRSDRYTYDIAVSFLAMEQLQ